MTPTKFHDPIEKRDYLAYTLKAGDVEYSCKYCCRGDTTDCLTFVNRNGYGCNSSAASFQVFAYDEPGANEEFHAKLALRRLESS